MVRLLGRIGASFVLITVATGLAYYLDLRRDLDLGIVFYMTSALATIAVAVTSRVESPALVASISAAGTLAVLVLGFAWRLPVSDNDGLWIFHFGYLGVLVSVEWLISWELASRRIPE